MTKLTDDDVARLLRETFADKENLVDHLPEATTRASRPRRTGPVLLAAASVLVILGGILYAAGATGGKPDPNPAQSSVTVQSPAGTTQVIPTESLIWAAAIEGILQREQPTGKVSVLFILDAPYQGAGGGNQVRGKPFSEAQRIGIENALNDVAPVQWVRSRPGGAKVCDQPPAKSPYITLGPVVSNDGHVEVGINLWRGCLNARWLTFRLDQQGSSWKVTGTVGPEAVA